MTPALERALRRREALMNPRSDRGGGGAGLASLLGGGAPGDVGPTLEQAIPSQGPGLPGATTGGITAPGKTHFFIRGRGPTIDFGPIFRPRSTGVNPMEGTPFQATTGVGGFFRRLLGDNSDELNDQWQQARINRGMQVADRQADWDFRRGLAQEDNAARGEEAQLSREQDEKVAQMQIDAANQRERVRTHNEMEQQNADQVHELLKQVSEQRFRSALLDKENAFRSSLFDRESGQPRPIGPNAFTKDGKVFSFDTGRYDFNTGGWIPPSAIELTPGTAPAAGPAVGPAHGSVPSVETAERIKNAFLAARTGVASTEPIPRYGLPQRTRLTLPTGLRSTVATPVESPIAQQQIDMQKLMDALGIKRQAPNTSLTEWLNRNTSQR